MVANLQHTRHSWWFVIDTESSKRCVVTAIEEYFWRGGRGQGKRLKEKRFHRESDNKGIPMPHRSRQSKVSNG